MAGKKIKKKHEHLTSHRNQVFMRLVTSETCQVCKSQCAAGIKYMERMKKPGAVGYGIPCILTAYKTKS